ncbi:hypothetical protein BJ165DRAFT_1452557 [Panaeolus papilionaceus]|nr:hypothetical protein BJ165DRAFT_1452557 [Panaeolus papilionaceus]
MSLDELKHASTASQRLLRKLYSGGPIDTTRKRHISLSHKSTFQLRASDLNTTESASDDNREFRRLCLVPGGRLLIAFSLNELLVYDLSAIKAASQDAPLLPLLRIPHDDDFAFIPCPSPDRKEIRLLSCKSRGPSKQQTAVVYRIKFADGECTPSVVCHSMDAEPFMSRFIHTIVGDLVLYIFILRLNQRRMVLRVWNYIEDTVANWAIPVVPYHEMFMHGKFVCTVTREAINLWALPTLFPRSYPQALEVQILEMALQIPLAVANIPRMGTCAKLHDWYNSFESPGSFDFPTTTYITHAFVQYTLPWDYLDRLTPTNKPLPYVTSEFSRKVYFLSNESDSFITSSYALCHGKVIKPSMLVWSGRIYIATTGPTNTSISSAKSDTAHDVMVELLLPKSIHPYVWPDELWVRKWDFSFDPMSGRLAYLSHDFKSIAVVEYLEYPLQTVSSS